MHTQRTGPTCTQPLMCTSMHKHINACYSGVRNKRRLKGKETIVGECKAVQHTLEDKLVCGPVYLFSWITFISVIVFFLGYLSQHVLSVYTSMRVDMRKKEVIYACGGQWVFSWGYSITEHHILNRECRSYIYLCFWKEKLNKDGYFFFTCSISFCHLCWDIPSAPWQGRMWWFPFQTGLSCPSHHQGSLLKYIPSVKARG